LKILQIFILGIILIHLFQPGYTSDQTVITLEKTDTPINVFSRRLTATIGDSMSVLFKTQLKLSAWENECIFAIDLSGNSTVAVDSVSIGLVNNTESIDIIFNNNIEHSIYKRADGNLEWEIILNSRPDTNMLVYEFTFDGLQFYFQDTANIDSVTSANSIFPDSTIYSWVAYHFAQRNNYRIINKNDTIFANYATGKAFHIFRPKAIDNAKKSVWCNLDIDTLRHQLSITIPEYFLKEATYPISIDPTIGETNSGMWFTNTTNMLHAMYYTHEAPIADGQLSKIYLYSYRDNAAEVCSTRGYVYDYDTVPANCDFIASSEIIAVTNGTTSDDAQWNEMNISGAISSSVEYMPAFRTDNNSLQVAYGFGSPAHIKYLTLNNWTAPNTLAGAGDYGNHWACYFEYTINSDSYRRRRIISGGR